MVSSRHRPLYPKRVSYYNRPNLKSGARTPPREYYAWWSQGILSICRLDHKKDICGLVSLVLLTQSLQFLYFTIHSQSICVRHCYKLYRPIHLFIAVTLPLSLLTRASAKKSPNAACASFAASTVIKHNSWLFAVSRKGYRMCRSQGDKAAVSLWTWLKTRRIPSRDKHGHELNTSNLEALTFATYQCTAHKRNLFTASPKIYFVLVMCFCLSLRRAYFWSGFEPGSKVTRP